MILLTVVGLSVLVWIFLFLMGAPTILLSEQYTLLKVFAFGFLLLKLLRYFTKKFNFCKMGYLDFMVSLVFAGFWLNLYFDNSNATMSKIVELHFDIYFSLITPSILCLICFVIVLTDFKEIRNGFTPLFLPLSLGLFAVIHVTFFQLDWNGEWFNVRTGSLHKIYATSNFLHGRAFLQYALLLAGAYVGIITATVLSLKYPITKFSKETELR